MTAKTKIIPEKTKIQYFKKLVLACAVIPEYERCLAAFVYPESRGVYLEERMDSGYTKRKFIFASYSGMTETKGIFEVLKLEHVYFPIQNLPNI